MYKCPRVSRSYILQKAGERKPNTSNAKPYHITIEHPASYIRIIYSFPFYA